MIYLYNTLFQSLSFLSVFHQERDTTNKEATEHTVHSGYVAVITANILQSSTLRNIDGVTDYNEYLSFIVVTYLRSRLITTYTCITYQMLNRSNAIVATMLTRTVYPSGAPWATSGFNSCLCCSIICFLCSGCGPLLVFLSLFFWPLYFLSVRTNNDIQNITEKTKVRAT